MEASRNNRGEAHENGAVESQNRHLKTAIAQALILRGSREFASIEDYRRCVDMLVARRNWQRADAIQAFLAAALAWCLCVPALIASSLFSSSLPIMAALAFAGFLTALWLLHVIVFGIRIALYTTGKTELAGGTEATEGKPHPSRRAFFPIMARAIAGMVLATAMPSRVAHAYCNCNDPNFYPCSNTACVPSGSDNACCPEGSQYLSHCDCLCYRSSADVNCGSYNYCH